MLGLGNSLSSYNVRHYNNWSLDFDGSDDVVNFGNVHNLGDTTDFSISVWFRRATNSNHYILGKEQNGDNKWSISTGADESVIFFASTSRTIRIRYVTEASVIPDNTTDWNHILVAVDRSNASNSGMWVNGVGMTLATETETGIDADLDNTGDFTIGAVGSNFAEGQITDVSIWNVAITPSGLIALSDLRDGTSGVGNATPADLKGKSGLVSWYRMGDGDTYPNVSDYVASNDGTMEDMTSGDIIQAAP